MRAIALPVRQGTPEWLAARRGGITSTDLPALLGIDPYGRCEADVAADKDGIAREEPDPQRARAMRLGSAMEDLVRAEDEIEHGWRLRRVRRLLRHPEVQIALTSLDFVTVGGEAEVIVEAKSSRARRWARGELPEDIEAQVRWQMGVTGIRRAHVAALLHGSELACFEVEHDAAVFDGLVKIASDFWRRYRAREPLAESAGSVKARYPADNGTEMLADADLAEAVHRLLVLRAQRRDLESAEEAIETAIKARMGEVAILRGPDFRVLWRRSKDASQTDWRAVADSLLAHMPETERAALVGRHTTVRPGFRPFRVVADKEES